MSVNSFRGLTRHEEEVLIENCVFSGNKMLPAQKRDALCTFRL
jgi:glycerate kinase